MQPIIKRPLGVIGLTILTIFGLSIIEYLYDYFMPVRLKAGQMLMTSFNPFTYPPAYWLTHLALVLVLLGSLAWAFGLRSRALLIYLGTAYLISLLGPLWMLLIFIYVFPAHR